MSINNFLGNHVESYTYFNIPMLNTINVKFKLTYVHISCGVEYN